MTPIAAQVLDCLTAQWEEEIVNLSSSHENFGDVSHHVEVESSDSESPILAQFVVSGGDNMLKGMTNFSSPELDALWALPAVTIAWKQGRRRKPSASGKNALFITLTVLKQFDTWHKHAIDFNMGVSTLDKMVHRAIQIIEPILYSQLVKRVKMDKQIEAGNTYTDYPHALYATNVNLPTDGRLTEQKVYFSAKHKLYGFKIKCSVVPPGVAIDVSDHAPGSRSDLTLSTRIIKELGRVFRTIHPRKQPRGGTLDREDIARNKAISADCVLVKDFFGRMCLLWKATYATIKWNENRFDSVARLCTARTNYHVGLMMPLRARDNEHYDMGLSKYQAMGERIRTQRARGQRQCRMQQQVFSRPAPYNTRVPVSQREPSLTLKKHLLLDRLLSAFQACFTLS
ncbi:LOW QUALITY PROTEIN: hypothetical protein PHMEG_0004469 [Phytophthora megakarya]|uniref:DDE Tnp4 domain-containing protein n=1 Tax=Phytophthora megakarya TaxID=4795 RepID=A0A225WTU9_9STRA|nr:LOW QUALITY PROTEIN: hypothetical protein PHMEG_0004469 [Phytophthora megakarya]